MWYTGLAMTLLGVDSRSFLRLIALDKAGVQDVLSMT